jgi:inosose dehydratase
MWTAYHPHLDTFVETREQLDQLMEQLDTKLCGLCIDPAHLVLTDSDPVAIVRDYADAVRYVHYKDTKRPADPSPPARYAAFCELGAGEVDLVGLTNQLLAIEYDGLVVIELDRSSRGAEESVEESIAYVQDVLGLQLNPAAIGAAGR